MKRQTKLCCTAALSLAALLHNRAGLLNKHAELPPERVGACVWHASEEFLRHKDAKILLVRYIEIPEGHAYCVYVRFGYTYGWDYRGETLIPDDSTGSAFDMACALPPPIVGLRVKSASLNL